MDQVDQSCFLLIRSSHVAYVLRPSLFQNSQADQTQDELSGLTLECVQPQLAPYGEGYITPGQQGCAIAGSTPGSTQVDGTTYLTQALSFSQSHMWRNFGIVVGLWLGFIFLLILSIERLPAAGSNQAMLLYKRGGGGKFIKASAKNGNGPRDEEEGGGERQITEKSGSGGGGGNGGGKKEEGKDDSGVHAVDT